MSDYQKGLVDGFKLGLEEGKKIKDHDLKERSYMDGYNDGLVEGMKKTLPPPYVPQPQLPGYTLYKETCPKCGIKISGVMGYVCSSINCPIFYKATSGVGQPMTGSEVSYSTGVAGGPAGAVGSMSDNMGSWSDSIGANGPCGPREPIDYSMR